MAGEIGAKSPGAGQAAKRLRGTDDQLQRRLGLLRADALMGDSFQEIAQKALEFGGQFLDAGKINESSASFFPEGFGVAKEFSGNRGDERALGSGTNLVKSLRGEELPGAFGTFDVHEAEMGRSAAHAGKEMLHDEAAPSHRSEHPAFRLKADGLKSLGIEAV